MVIVPIIKVILTNFICQVMDVPYGEGSVRFEALKPDEGNVDVLEEQ
jgi:hypothetical protein